MGFLKKNSGLERCYDRNKHEKDQKEPKKLQFRLADSDNDHFALARFTERLFYENYFIVGLYERNFR